MTCSVCGHGWTVTASRAARNKTITCSPPCRSEQASRNRLATTGTTEARKATCSHCGTPFVRKPSQLAKYATAFCGTACKQASRVGLEAAWAARTNGGHVPCEACGRKVWRTPGTTLAHVYCSRVCARGRQGRPGPRIVRLVLTCGTCSTPFRILPGHEPRGRQFCSRRCSSRAVQGAKRGIPGQPKTPEQRAQISATLLRRYEHEWGERRVAHSARMSGRGNPQWRDGRATRAYGPGWTDRVKMLVAKRDRFRCQICGAPRRPETHVVHHIDGEKYDHRLVNLILLCRPCHGKVHAGKANLPSRQAVTP